MLKSPALKSEKLHVNLSVWNEEVEVEKHGLAASQRLADLCVTWTGRAKKLSTRTETRAPSHKDIKGLQCHFNTGKTRPVGLFLLAPEPFFPLSPSRPLSSPPIVYLSQKTQKVKEISLNENIANNNKTTVLGFGFYFFTFCVLTLPVNFV